MKPLVFLALSAALALPRAMLAQAQFCNGGSTTGTATCGNPSLTVSASFSVNAVARLSINNGTSATTTLVTPTASDFGTTAGVTSTGPTLTVLSNGAFTLTAAAATTTWTGPSGTSKPSSHLKMKVNGVGSFLALGQVATSTAGTAGTNYAISYNTIYDWMTDKPGTYTLVVNYTLTAP